MVIKGTGFVSPATVTIGNAATSVTVKSATEITATTAATAAGGDEVVVKDANGTSTGGPTYTYKTPPPPPPTVTSITPIEGSTAGGTAVVIKGTGFVSPATVTIGNAATSVTVKSATEITATTAATAAGGDEVVVKDANGTSTGGPTYTYKTPPPPPPTVTSITPIEGSTAGGTAVVIKGTGFVSPATVTIGNAATSVTVKSATEITATTAATAAGGDEVVVKDANGTSTGGPTYTYKTPPPPPPTVTSITPIEGSTAGGTAVVIKGTGFVSPATVTIGNAATSVTVKSATEITATTAATAAGGDEVVVKDANGTSTGGPTYTYKTPPPPPPTVTSITPIEGSTAGGTAVVIKGTGFVSPATVTIGNAATSVTVKSATEITATTAATAAGGDEVVVKDANGTSTGGPTYTYKTPPPPPPTVTSITPIEGSTAGGTAVVIKGTGFVSPATVTIGNAATSVTVKSATEITATTAATAAGGDEVVVKDANGTSTGGPTYTYKTPPPPPPTVTSITPIEGSTAGGTAVVIKGTGFVSPATVTIGNAATSVTVKSATEITATTAATAAGGDEVVVKDANGTSTGGPTYTYKTPPPPPPTVTSITPIEGSTAGGTAVVIKGTGFVSPATVTIGNAATSVTVKSATEITATTAATAAGGDEVVVKDANGTSTGGPTYTYKTPPPPPPTVTSITPIEGSTAGGTAVVIKGTGFVSPATVTIGNAATSVTVKSATEITATTAATAAGGDEVVVKDANGTSTGGPTYTYKTPPPPPPTVTSITPIEGSTAGGTAVVIKGTGFVSPATVTIGNAATSVTVKSATEITATTAATAAGGDEVVVKDANGTSTGGPTYTYVAATSPEAAIHQLLQEVSSSTIPHGIRHELSCLLSDALRSLAGLSGYGPSKCETALLSSKATKADRHNRGHAGACEDLQQFIDVIKNDQHRRKPKIPAKLAVAWSKAASDIEASLGCTSHDSSPGHSSRHAPGHRGRHSNGR